MCLQEVVGSKRKSAPDSIQNSDKRVRRSDDSVVRRSSRHHKARGEKPINVAATQKLWDLKIMVRITMYLPRIQYKLELNVVFKIM